MFSQNRQTTSASQSSSSSISQASNEVDNLTELPIEMLTHIAGYLPDKLSAENPQLSPLRSFARTCGLFADIAAPRLLPKLLQFVANGEQKLAEALLASVPNLLFYSGTVTDYAGRTFTNITPLQLAAWSWDMPMWTMMLNCLPKNEEGEKIRIALLQQCEELDKNIEYSLEDKPYRSSHFDFLPLIRAYERYLALLDAQPQDLNAIHNHWCTVVGKAQRYLPAELRQRFCGNKSFHPTPTFTDKDFKRSLKLDSLPPRKVVVWDNSLDDLGVNFGILRGARLGEADARLRRHGAAHYASERVVGVGGAEAVRAHYWPREPLADLAAVTAYCKVRTKNYAELKALLQNPIQVAVQASSEVPQEESRRVIP